MNDIESFVKTGTQSYPKSQDRIPPARKTRKRKLSLITKEAKNGRSQLSISLIGNDDDEEKDLSETTNTNISCHSPIYNFTASPHFSYHHIEEEREGEEQEKSETSIQHDGPISMTVEAEELGSSTSSLSSNSRSHSRRSVSCDWSGLDCIPPSPSSSSTSPSLLLLSRQKYNCEAAWKLRSALRDDASKIFQATWQEAERQKPILKKVFGSFKTLLM